MDIIFEDLDVCGIMFFIYALSRLLDYWRQSLIFDNAKQHLQLVLTICCIILWVISAPIAIIMFGLNYLHDGLSESQYRKSEIKRSNENCVSCHKHIIDPLKLQISKLKDDLLDESFSAHEDGFKGGLHSGYRDGYRECYKNYLECTGPFAESENVSYLDVVHYSDYISNEIVKEYERKMILDT